MPISNYSPQFAGGLFVGAGGETDRFYFGAELQVSANNAHGEIFNGTLLDSKIKMPSSLSLDIRPGYFVVDKKALAFMRLGVSGGKLESSSDNVIKNDSNLLDNFVVGWRAGLGTEFYCSDSFSIRGEYIFTNYANHDLNFYNPSTGLTDSIGFKTRTNQFMLGFAYNF